MPKVVAKLSAKDKKELSDKSEEETKLLLSRRQLIRVCVKVLGAAASWLLHPSDLGNVVPNWRRSVGTLEDMSSA